MCYSCGKINSTITLSDRVFKCDCGLEEDRDIKSAKTILKVGRLKFPYTERICTPLEEESSTRFLAELSKNHPLKEDAPKSLASG